MSRSSVISGIPLPNYAARPNPRPDIGGHYYDGDEWVPLNLSESGFGCSPAALQAVRDEVSHLHRYPDTLGCSLAGAIAERYSLHPDQIVLGNGIDELLLLTAVGLGHPQVGAVVTRHTYAGHRNAAATARIPCHIVPLSAELTVDIHALAEAMTPGSLVYVCNPHNPTGSALAAPDVRALALYAEAAGATVVFDEAYIDYAWPDETRSAMDLVREGLPVLVLRTFSKIYGLAGLRCGYAVGRADLAAEVRKPKHVLVFNVNRLALVAAEAALRDEEFTATVRRQTRAIVADTAERLAAADAGRALRSTTNFLLAEFAGNASVVAGKLADRRVLVRDCTDLDLPRHIRISAGTAAQTSRAVAAIAQVAGELRSAGGE